MCGLSLFHKSLWKSMGDSYLNIHAVLPKSNTGLSYQIYFIPRRLVMFVTSILNWQSKKWVDTSKNYCEGTNFELVSQRNRNSFWPFLALSCKSRILVLNHLQLNGMLRISEMIWVAWQTFGFGLCIVVGSFNFIFSLSFKPSHIRKVGNEKCKCTKTKNARL